MNELNKLPDGELNRIAAVEVMGWTRVVYSSWRMEGHAEPFENAMYTPGKDGYSTYDDDWNPTTSHNDAARLREEIERRGLCDRFINALSELLCGLTFWSVATSTPRQTTMAAIAAVRGMKK